MNGELSLVRAGGVTDHFLVACLLRMFRNSMKTLPINDWSFGDQALSYANQALVLLHFVCTLLILRQITARWLGDCGTQLVAVYHPHA